MLSSIAVTKPFTLEFGYGIQSQFFIWFKLILSSSKSPTHGEGGKQEKQTLLSHSSNSKWMG